MCNIASNSIESRRANKPLCLLCSLLFGKEWRRIPSLEYPGTGIFMFPLHPSGYILYIYIVFVAGSLNWFIWARNEELLLCDQPHLPQGSRLKLSYIVYIYRHIGHSYFIEPPFVSYRCTCPELLSRTSTACSPSTSTASGWCWDTAKLRIIPIPYYSMAFSGIVYSAQSNLLEFITGVM